MNALLASVDDKVALTVLQMAVTKDALFANSQLLKSYSLGCLVASIVYV
jgi:hypothetical protein